MRPESPKKAQKAPLGQGKRPVPSGSVRAGVLYGAFAGLFGTNVLTLVALLMAPDIAVLLDGRTDLVYSAYEDRIAELRLEVDRLHSRQFAQAGDINLQLQELNQQQEVLLEQHQYVRQLAQRASEMGIRTAEIPDEAEAAALEHAALAPEADATVEIARTADLLRAMLDDSRLALAAISTEANEATEEILAELRAIGIRPKLRSEETAMGGPFLPATTENIALSIVDDANAAYEALARLRTARGAVDLAPVHRPIAGGTRMSSTFGNRKDPFTKRLAFHAGIDFAAPSGTTVLSAGAGKVTFAGKRSGYGNLVEVTHSDGLVTRYAHLSAFIAKVGQKVQPGTPIARVGSTGRSTGPHLHFEVRLGDKPLDPSRYLAAGKRLMRFLSA